MSKSVENKLICPVCQGVDFNKDAVVLPKYGLFRLTDYKLDVYICQNCKHVVMFEKGSTFFLGVD